MKITIPNKKAPVILVSDLYSQSELEQMFFEINSLCSHQLGPEQTGGSKVNNILQKNTKGLFLDTHYKENRHLSKCLKFNRKIFIEENMIAFEKAMPCFSLLATSSKDTTLITWYGDKTFYKTHRDTCSVTCLTYFIPEQDSFSGGLLVFDDFDLKIKPENGLIVLMLGSLKHSVTVVNTLIKDKKTPRIVMSQFICHEDRAS